MKTTQIRFLIYQGVLAAGSGCFAAGRAPSDGEVARKLQQILRTDPTFKGEPFAWRLPEEISRWLSRGMRDPVLILVAGVLLVGMFFLVRKCLPYLEHGSLVKQLNRENEPGESESGDTFTFFHQQALQRAGAGEYRLAVIALHKATVEYLTSKAGILTPGKIYSNNDLKRKLQDHPSLRQPFALIANYAEIAGFSIKNISQADFLRAREVFEQQFLQQLRSRSGR